MKPQHIYEIELSQMVTAIKLPAGHSVRIEIAGSNSPAYERNLHTGGRNFDESALCMARNSIFHDAKHASYIELSVIEDTRSPSITRQSALP